MLRNLDALILLFCIQLGILTTSPSLVVTSAVPFSLHDCTLIINQLTPQPFLEAHLLSLRGFQAWRGFISKFGTVQSVLHLKWSYLSSDYDPWMSGVQTGVQIPLLLKRN